MRERKHELKTWPEPFEAIRSGKKRYEIRYDDRGFAVGDVLHLLEYDPSRVADYRTPKSLGYTGEKLWAKVTYITPGGVWGLPQNICVMSIELFETRPA